MDTFVLISMIFGILKISQAEYMLRCMECEHIGWNMTYSFEGVQNIYQLLQSKYNPACAMVNPRDQNTFNQQNQNQQNLQNQQQFLNNNPQQPGNNFFQNRYEVRETICPVKADTNRCSYVHGIAIVYLPSYNNKMSLAMHVRNCADAVNDVENRCYQRDTQYGYSEVRNFIQNKLQFLGSATVERFVGWQCYCNSDMCYPDISSARNLVASAVSLLLALIAFVVIN